MGSWSFTTGGPKMEVAHVTHDLVLAQEASPVDQVGGLAKCQDFNTIVFLGEGTYELGSVIGYRHPVVL
jgi:hypothetical protein